VWYLKKLAKSSDPKPEKSTFFKKTFYCKCKIQDKTQEKTRQDTRPTAHQDARHALE
jgi:hypothetical protein